MNHITSLIPELVSESQTAHEAKKAGRPLGPMTGLAQADRELGGCLQPGLHVLLGQPGCGKSALALQISTECGRPALFVSAEQCSIEIARRIIARRTETFLGRLKSGELPPATIEQLAIEAFEALDLYLLDATAASTAEEVAEGIQAIESKHGERPLVVVDSLQAWTRAVASSIASSEFEQLEASVLALVHLARDRRVAVLLVSHRNRVANRATDGGGLFGGKGSGSIEYLAETVLALDH